MRSSGRARTFPGRHLILAVRTVAHCLLVDGGADHSSAVVRDPDRGRADLRTSPRCAPATPPRRRCCPRDQQQLVELEPTSRSEDTSRLADGITSTRRAFRFLPIACPPSANDRSAGPRSKTTLPGADSGCTPGRWPVSDPLAIPGAATYRAPRSARGGGMGEPTEEGISGMSPRTHPSWRATLRRHWVPTRRRSIRSSTG